MSHPAARRRQAGFTLIEIMMAMIVSGIVLLGVFAFSSIQQGTAVIHRRHVRIQQALEGSMYSISRDVRMAGLGFARLCTEVRVWDPGQNKLINPGGTEDVSQVVLDLQTGEPYWVLRDGLQAHWRSDTALSINGDTGTSASPTSAADSFDVLLGERNLTSTMGVFTLAEDAPIASAANARLVAKTGATGPTVLDSGNADHLNWVRQLFPPGSFVLVARPVTGDLDPFRPENRGQCALLQVTDDILAGADSSLWDLPVGSISGFNADLGELFGPVPTACPDGTCDDWRDEDRKATALVVPLGRMRWSRYAIDYTVAGKPYLVRSDLIGWLNGDPTEAADTPYPDCPDDKCQLPQLHLPGDDVGIPKVAIGPMIEDMQVAVGCDGYTAAAAVDDTMHPAIPVPDMLPVDFGEVGDETNSLPNKLVDEWVADKTRDEWLGNAAAEQWAPDCVFYGTGQEFIMDAGGTAWSSDGPASEQLPGAGFHMSPQAFRVTLLAKSETQGPGEAEDTSLALYHQLFPIEDRAQMDTIAGAREYLTLTERFTPRNLRWRDPLIQ